LGRLGDSLLHAGRYAEAANTFREYATNPDPGEPIWQLKEFTAQAALRSHGGNQDRDTGNAESLAEAALAVGDHDQAVAFARQALALDAACGTAWWALGRWHVNVPQDMAAALPMLLAGLGMGGGVDAWAEGLLAALLAGSEDEVTVVARAGYQSYSIAFLDAVRSRLEDIPSEVRAGVLRELSQVVADLDSSQQWTLRISDGEEFQELIVRGDHDTRQ
jgi:tetratricopeptide (TPR) repeat protein